MSYAIAIDGPSGAGKSTIAKRVAKEPYSDSICMALNSYYMTKSQHYVGSSSYIFL